MEQCELSEHFEQSITALTSVSQYTVEFNNLYIFLARKSYYQVFAMLGKKRWKHYIRIKPTYHSGNSIFMKRCVLIRFSRNFLNVNKHIL